MTRTHGGPLRLIAALVLGGLIAILAPSTSAEARCVTVGIDGIGHKQCNLP